MVYNYSFQNFEKETMAKACSTNAQISLKKSVECARVIKGKKVSTAIKYLEKVIVKEAVVPFRKYRAEMAHQRGKGIDTGGFPVNVAKEILRVLLSAQKNASEKELSEELYIMSISARKGTQRYHTGRHMGRKMKSTNLEVIVGEKKKND